VLPARKARITLVRRDGAIHVTGSVRGLRKEKS